MPDTFVIRSRRVVTPQGMRPAAVIIRGGLIADVVDHGRIPVSCRVDDVGDRVVMPGLVDTHVHINEPGRTEWEGFETATQAAAVGGITTLIDMPLNSSPVTVTVEALAQKVVSAKGKLWVDCGFHGGLVPGHEADVEKLIHAGVFGIKAFLVHSGIDEFPAATRKELLAVMPTLAQHKVPLLVHAELDHVKPAVDPAATPQSYEAYLASRPREWENEAISMLISLCREYTCPIHIVHLSSADALHGIMTARVEGLPLTVETCPHYLYFRAEEIPDGDTRFKCAPPIREGENNAQLWAALHSGFVDMVCTDHSPCPPAMKRLSEGDFSKAWGGASLQVSLPVVWTAARLQQMSIEDVSRWMSFAPARLVGLERRKGSIEKGHDADLVVFNPDVPFTVSTGSLYHRHKLTPYEGRTLYGLVEKTYLRGRKIAEDGVALAGASGQVLRRAS